MLGEAWRMSREAVEAFFEDRALSRGAAIAFYIMTAFAPVLYITAAVAASVFGAKVTYGALSEEIRHVIGPGAGKLVHAALQNTLGSGAGFWPNVFGAVLVIVTASGVFGEIQATLNDFWKAAPRFSVVALVRTRLISLALVLVLGFLLMISLVLNAAITAFGMRIQDVVPIGPGLVWSVNFIASFVLVAVLFAAIYKVVPDVELVWGDVIAGALVTALLFEAGEYLIGLYLSTTSVGSRYGTAGSLFVLLIWIYYTTQVFLLGAEFTKVYSLRHGSRAHEAHPVPAAATS
jgi:membrane protein